MKWVGSPDVDTWPFESRHTYHEACIWNNMFGERTVVRGSSIDHSIRKSDGSFL